MIRRATLILAAALTTGAIASPAQAQLPIPLPGMQGTKDEQSSCHPDFIKYCKQFGEDQFAVLRCLQENRPKISKACEKVLESHGQ
jgi:hypothetical protein